MAIVVHVCTIGGSIYSGRRWCVLTVANWQPFDIPAILCSWYFLWREPFQAAQCFSSGQLWCDHSCRWLSIVVSPNDCGSINDNACLMVYCIDPDSSVCRPHCVETACCTAVIPQSHNCSRAISVSSELYCDLSCLQPATVDWYPLSIWYTIPKTGHKLYFNSRGEDSGQNHSCHCKYPLINLLVCTQFYICSVYCCWRTWSMGLWYWI